MSNNDDNTPDPGIRIDEIIAKPIISKFLKIYRIQDPTIPSNLPTCCILEGIKNSLVLYSNKFLSYKKVYLLYEPSKQLYEVSPPNFLDYLRIKQPWEDYNMCVFDEDMTWCIGVTHNDDVIVVDTENYFEDK